jgi:hypothetical protein
LWLKLVSASGFLVSVLYIGFTVVPIISVESRLAFAVKIILVVVVANAIGAFVFVTGRRKTSAVEVFQKMQEET